MRWIIKYTHLLCEFPRHFSPLSVLLWRFGWVNNTNTHLKLWICFQFQFPTTIIRIYTHRYVRAHVRARSRTTISQAKCTAIRRDIARPNHPKRCVHWKINGQPSNHCEQCLRALLLYLSLGGKVWRGTLSLKMTARADGFASGLKFIWHFNATNKSFASTATHLCASTHILLPH